MGCARSGTTLLQSQLVAGTAAVTFPETNFLPWLVGGLRGRRLGSDLLPTRDRWLARANRLRVALDILWPLGPEVRGRLESLSRELGARSARLDSRRISGAYRRYLSLLEDASSGRPWVEKSPNHVYYLDWILRRDPAARVIHLWREGEATVASIVHAARAHPEGGHDFTADPVQATRRWGEAVRWVRELEGHPRYLSVRFESFLAEPDRELARVRSFLALPPADGKAPEGRPWIRQHEIWKMDATLPPRSAGSSRFEELFEVAQRRAIRSELARYLVP